MFAARTCDVHLSLPSLSRTNTLVEISVEKSTSSEYSYQDGTSRPASIASADVAETSAPEPPRAAEITSAFQETASDGPSPPGYFVSAQSLEPTEQSQMTASEASEGSLYSKP